MINRLRFIHIYAFFCLLLAGALFSGVSQAAQIARPGPELQTLSIANATKEDVLSIGFQTGRHIQFVRLDMGPGGKDEMENPGGVADLRVDTGLALWRFKEVPLAQAQGLTLREAETPVLELATGKGPQRRIAGEVQNLLPGPDAGPVCALDRFRPGMSMKEVCALLDPNPQRDDNDALLTSLGFAGMVWAARLEPAQDKEGPHAAKGAARLAHMELRRKLDAETLEKLFSTLNAQKYSPWQAELPGLDINFTQMPGMDPEKQKDMLRKVLEYFLATGKGEASIMLAPAAMLPQLADADGPHGDVQLFSVILRPESGNLVVDVAAYQEGDSPSN